MPLFSLIFVKIIFNALKMRESSARQLEYVKNTGGNYLAAISIEPCVVLSVKNLCWGTFIDDDK